MAVAMAEAKANAKANNGLRAREGKNWLVIRGTERDLPFLDAVIVNHPQGDDERMGFGSW